jgi:hypothetical protein
MYVLAADEPGDDIAKPETMLNVSVEVETWSPLGRPLVPHPGRNIMGVDEHAVVVEQYSGHLERAPRAGVPG